MAVTTTKTASWGVKQDSPVTGVITDYEDANEPVLQPEHNEMGSTINQTMNDIHYTCSFTVQVAAATAKPASGTQIQIGGQTWYVTNSRVTESNNAYRKIAVNAERFALCNATEAVSGITAS